MVSETIGNSFLILQKYAKKVCQCTSETSEHTFRKMMANQECTVADFCLLTEKEKCRIKALFQGDHFPSRTGMVGVLPHFLIR